MRIGLRLQLGGALPESTCEDECYQALSSCMQSTEYCFSLLIVSFLCTYIAVLLMFWVLIYQFLKPAV